MNNITASNESLYSNKTTASAPVASVPEPSHRPFTEKELNTLTRRTSKDLGDERLKQFLEKDLHSHDEDEEDTRGIGSGIPRRSLRSFRSRKKRHRSVKRTVSMDAKIPNIIVTSPSREDNRMMKVNTEDGRMVKVIHL